MDLKRIRTDLLALGLLALTAFAAASLVSYDAADPPSTVIYPPRQAVLNWCGTAGAYLAHFLRMGFGLGAYFVLLSLAACDVELFSRNDTQRSWPQWLGTGLVLTASCIALHLLLSRLEGAPLVGSGGYLGAFGTAILESQFNTAGVVILLMSMLATGVLLAPELELVHTGAWCLIAPFRRLGRCGQWLLNRRAATYALAPTEVVNTDDEDFGGFEAVQLDPPAAAPLRPRAAPEGTDTNHTIKVNPPVTAGSHEELAAQLDARSLVQLQDRFQLPDLDLLEHPEEFPYELLATKARQAAATLEKTFQDFGLNVRVAEIDTGPVITLFELELEPGLRVNKITALADDLAIALRVPSVRVVPSIPGKNTVGVEVPNEKQVMVRLRELIASSPDAVENLRIPLFVGKDVNGRPLTVDMTRMPHLLIAGRTGTGKSVCLNSLILSILMTRTPDEVKMLLIDPKMVELSPYKRVPHLMHPVITDMKKAEAVLAWAVDKMEERYDLLARCGVRHLDNYNKLGKARVLERLGIDPCEDEADKIPDRMPYIVIIADEMADMMMTSGKDVEGHIIRLAQKSRAVGIHLVMATQKPTVDVITGLIKSNLPARISFQVASRMDSRVVLDEMGAERLLGNGDMLYLAPGTSHLTRAQGTYVSDEEINNVIDFYRDHQPEYNQELAQLSAAGSGPGDAQSRADRDELYEQAIDVVVREGRGSVSLLQRCLGIGYGRAARLIDYMAEDGIVGDYNGSQAREVLYTPEQWEALKAGTNAAEPAVAAV